MSATAKYTPRTEPKHAKAQNCCQWLGTTKFANNTWEIYKCGDKFYNAHYSPKRAQTIFGEPFGLETIDRSLTVFAKDIDYCKWLNEVKAIMTNVPVIDTSTCTCGGLKVGYLNRAGHSNWCDYKRF